MTGTHGIGRMASPGHCQAGVWRSDLVDYWRIHGSKGLEQAAAAMGFFPVVALEVKAPSSEKLGDRVMPGPAPGLFPGPGKQQATTFHCFWRVVKYEEKEVEDQQVQVPAWMNERVAFTMEEFVGENGLHLPPKPPLMSWSHLWPFLKWVMGHMVESIEINIGLVVERLAQGKALQNIPRIRRLNWSGPCQVILDASESLMPFWDDEAGLVRSITRLRGRSGLEMLVMEHGPGHGCRYWGKWQEQVRPYSLPEPGTPILVLSDLGCLDRQGQTRHAWLRFGKRLKQAGFVPIVLVPCPVRSWDKELLRYFKMACWDRGVRLPRPGQSSISSPGLFPQRQEEKRQGVEELLTLLAPAVHVEPALLRAMRLLLPRDQVDVGTEAATWWHNQVMVSPTAMVLSHSLIVKYREAFLKKPAPLPQRAMACIRFYHSRLPAAARAEENLLAAAMRPSLQGADVIEIQGREFFERVVKTQTQGYFPGLRRIGEWVQWWGERMPHQVWQDNDVLAAAWVMENLKALKQGHLNLPLGLNLQKVKYFFYQAGEPIRWVLRQKGDGFILDNCDWFGTDQPEELSDRGCPLTILTSRDATLTINYSNNSVEKKFALYLGQESPPSFKMKMPDQGKFSLETDHERVVVESFSGHERAIETRDSREGLSAVFKDKTREQRLFRLNSGKYPVFHRKENGEIKKEPSFFLVRNTGCWMDPDEYKQVICFGFVQPTWADEFGKDQYGLYAVFRIKGVAQRMRFIMPGEFMMGSPETELDRYDEEIMHPVMLTRGYWLADTACTQELWVKVMGDNPSRFKGGQSPVENVSWKDCQDFIDKLNHEKIGLDLRLPTEAEWEYACRAGAQTPFSFGDNITPDQVNYDGNYPYLKGKRGQYRVRTVVVKTLPCNPWGLYEMHGNVWEWCADWYGEYKDDFVLDPVGPIKGYCRVLRGGSWSNGGRIVRSACRYNFVPPNLWDVTGFRLARSQK